MKHKLRDVSIVNMLNEEIHVKDFKKIVILDKDTVIEINKNQETSGIQCYLTHIGQGIKIPLQAVIDYLMMKETTHSFVEIEY